MQRCFSHGHRLREGQVFLIHREPRSQRPARRTGRDANGNEKWVKRYDGSAHGDDQATAIAVDNAGNVYVTGFSQNTSGGYDLTTIKYAFLQNIQLLTNGNAFLQFFGTPGTNYRFQGSINLSNWVDIGSNVADTNGIYRFEDTNSPAYPHRFYRTVTP